MIHIIPIKINKNCYSRGLVT